MSVEAVLSSEPALALLGTVLGGLWTFFKSSEWYGRTQRRRFNKALKALEAAVEQTYRTYVRAIKEAREDGRLTEEEMRHARSIARHTAIEFGRTQRIDVLRELGEEYLDLWIAKLVKKLKNR